MNSAAEETSNVRAVIFDYFYTLADPGATGRRALAALLDEVLPGMTEDEFLAARANYLRERPQRIEDVTHFQSYAEQWRTHGEGLFTYLGVRGVGPRYAAARFAGHAQAPLYPDATPALDALRERGTLTAILSDADTEYLPASVKGNALAVDVVVSSEELQRYKPDASTFVEVCRRLNISPQEAVVVGDSPVNDIEGASWAGLRAVWLNRAGAAWPLTSCRPAAEIAALTELLPLVTA